LQDRARRASPEARQELLALGRELRRVEAAVLIRVHAAELAALEGERDLGLAQRQPTARVEVAEPEVLAQDLCPRHLDRGAMIRRGRDLVGLLHRIRRLVRLGLGG